MFIYENHMGGLYATEVEQDYEELYCETCGDSDQLIGRAETKEEAWELLKEDTGRNGMEWDYEYVRNFIDKWFGE